MPTERESPEWQVPGREVPEEALGWVPDWETPLFCVTGRGREEAAGQRVVLPRDGVV